MLQATSDVHSKKPEWATFFLLHSALMGDPLADPRGDFWMWFSDQAFGGTQYSNTPVGAVTHTDEPGALGVRFSEYFGMWASRKCFARCAWASKGSELSFFQVVGDPLVIR